MQNSSYYQYLSEKFKAEYMPQGIAQGRTEGITEGEKKATLKNLLVVLNAKFHAASVRAIVPALEKIDDLERLEQLLLAAVNAENLETFTEALFE